MLSRKNIYIIIGLILAALIVWGVYLWYNIAFQTSGENTEQGVQQEQSGGNNSESDNLTGPEENSSDGASTGNGGQNGGLIICRDDCGNGVCQQDVCTDDMNCPCPETPEECPQDCKD